MLAIVTGTIEPQATGYMRSLLQRPRFSAHSPLGGGLPPGTQYENKLGNAFDTLQDVMHAQWPDGHELIVAAYSNGWDEHEREPWDVARLNDFAWRLVHELNLERSSPPSRIVPAPDASANGDEMRWHWHTRSPGRYEIAAWYDASPANTPRAIARVEPGGLAAEGELDLTSWGRRWIRLGDFVLARGPTEVVLTRAAPGSLAPARLRVTAWPRTR
jgi:protein phosphatase methylesterase 1